MLPMNLRIFILFFIFPFSLLAQQFKFTIEKKEGCNSLTTKFVNNSLDTVNYAFEWKWQENVSVFVSNVNANFSVGTHEVTMTVKDMANNLVTVVRDTVVVHKNPFVRIISDKTNICYQDAVQYTIDSVSAESDLASYKWVFGDGTTSSKAVPDPHPYNQIGNYKASVIVEDAFGCSSGQSDLIDISVTNEKPSAAFIADKTYSCSNEMTVNFTDGSIPFPERSISEYVWDFGDGTVVKEKDPSHVFTNFGSNKVTLTVVQDNGCTSSANKYIILSEFKVGFKANDEQKPLINLTETSMNACAGEIQFTSTGTTAQNYMWDIGNDSVVEHEGVGIFYSTFNYTFDTAGIYPVRLYTSNNIGCEATLVDTIVVEEPISISYLNDTIFSCDTQDVHILTIDLNSPVDSIVWTLNNNSILGSNAPTINTKLKEGIHNLSIQTVTGSLCKTFVEIDSFAEVLQPRGVFYNVSQLSGCIPLNVNFTGDAVYNPKIGVDSVVSFEWDLNDDGTPEATGVNSASYIYANTGTNVARLKVTSAKGCETSTSFAIYTGDTATLGFSITQDICTWQDAEFTQLTDLQTGSLADTVWYMVYSADDTTRIANEDTLISPPGTNHALHFNDTTGVFKLRMMASDHGCHSNWLYADSVITVRGPIVSMDKLFDCETPYDYSFFTSKLIDADSISWNVFKYDTAYPYNDITREIPPYTLVASNSDNNSDTLHHTFSARGDYYIQLIANNYTDAECADTSTIEWLAVRDLLVDFEFANYESCVGDILIFDNNAVLTAQDMQATKLTWNTSVGRDSLYLSSTENKNDIKYKSGFLSYPEKGDLELMIHAKDLNGCIDSASKMVSIYKPTTKFFINNASNCLPYEVVLIDSTISRAGIAERFWTTEGDTNTYVGNDSIIVDIISSQGARSPSLTVVDSFGCRASYFIENGIAPIVPDSRFVLANNKICAGGDATIQLVKDGNADYTFPADSIVWYINDEYFQTTNDSAFPNPYLCDTSGQHKIEATAYIMSGTNELCSNTDSLLFDVKDMKIRLPFDGTNICKGPFEDALLDLGDTIYDGFDDVNSIQWYVDDVSLPTVLYAENIRLAKEGAQEVKMLVTSEYDGCEVMKDSIDVNVYNNQLSISVDKTQICIGEEIHYSINISDSEFFNTVPHYWLTGDGNRIDGTHSAITYVYDKIPDGASVEVSFIVDEDAQENSACKSVKATEIIGIYPIEVDFIRAGSDTLLKGCAPFEIDFQNISEGTDNTYRWEIDTAIFNTKDASYTFTEPGKKYPVTLNLINSSCTQKKHDTVYVYSNPAPNLQTESFVVCDYETVQIVAGGAYANVTAWEYNGERYTKYDTAISAVFANDSKVKVYVLSEDKCAGEDSIEIVTIHTPYFTGAPEGGLLYYSDQEPVVMLQGEKALQLVANGRFNFNNDSLDGISYRWEPIDYLSCTNCASPYIDLSCGSNFPCTDIPDNISYTVFMSDTLGCFVDVPKEISFQVIKEAKLGMPTAFSPNGDGLNDIAFARGWATTEFISMQIFNRWGQIVFETADISVGWDGTMEGKPQKAGAYAYVIKGLDESNSEIVSTGYITLMR